jgi:hypothetical protein
MEKHLLSLELEKWHFFYALKKSLLTADCLWLITFLLYHPPKNDKSADIFLY